MDNFKSKLEFSRTVANGDLYLCPCCGAEIFLGDTFITYCDECGAEFDDDFDEE